MVVLTSLWPSSSGTLRMPHGTRPAMPTHKELDPVDIALFCLKAVMHIPEAFANPVQQPGCNQRRTIRFAVLGGVGITGYKSSITRKTPNIKAHSDSGECDTRRRDRAKGRICCVSGIARALFNRQRWKTGYKSTTCRIRFFTPPSRCRHTSRNRL